MKKSFKSFALAICLMTILFTGTAAYAMEPINIRIPVVCKDKGGEFAISTDEENVVIENETVTVLGNSTGSFSVNVDEPDDYHFVIKQLAGSEKKVVYDKAVYDVTVHVTTDNNGAMGYKIVIKKDGTEDKSDEAVYENYIPSKPDKPGKKDVVTGDSREVMLYAFMAGALSAVLLVLLFMRNRSKKD